MKRCLNCMEEYQDNLAECPFCDFDGGAQELPVFVLKVGTFLQDRYIVGTCRSVRACDITYIGWDRLFERKVLLQEFYPFEYVTRENETDAVAKEGRDELYAEGLRHFIQYHRSLIRLYKEEDIVEVYSCFIANGTAYATTRYSEAETLWDWMEKNSEKAKVWDYMMFVRRAVLALQKVHAMGLIHGAVGLDSFWVTSGKGLVLKGFAEPLYYMEKIGKNRGGREGQWVDIYELALMAGRMLAGEKDMKPQRLSMWLRQNQEELPARIVNALEYCLEPDGSRNINTLDDFYAAIFSEEETIQLESKSAEKTDSDETGAAERWRERLRKKRRRRLGIIVCLGVAVLTGVFLMYGKWMHRKDPGPSVEAADKRDAKTAAGTFQDAAAGTQGITESEKSQEMASQASSEGRGVHLELKENGGEYQ